MVTINFQDYFQQASRSLGIQIEQMGFFKDTLIPFIRLRNGLIFHGLPILHSAEEPLIDFRKGALDKEFQSKILKSLFTIIQDISFRYFCKRGIVQHAYYQFKSGDIIIELGAYLGYYAMFVAQHIGPKGKIIAVELMPENYHVLSQNLKTNFPVNSLAVNKGIYSRSGVKKAYSGGCQVCSLREDVVSKFNPQSKEVTVETETVDVNEVDFMVIQINGSEIEALKGMNRSLSMVKNFAIAAPYGREERDHVQIVHDIMTENGFEVKVDRTMVYARNTHFS